MRTISRNINWISYKYVLVTVIPITLITCFAGFDVHGSVYRKRIFQCNQQNATLHNLFISVRCFTCFWRFPRPSSGAQTIYRASGTLSKLYCSLPLSWKRRNSNSISPTTVQVAVKFCQNTRCCIYSLSSWWWAEEPPETCRKFHRNKLRYVASCWLHLKINFFFWVTALSLDDLCPVFRNTSVASFSRVKGTNSSSAISHF